MGNLYYYETDIGKIGIAEQNDKITYIFFEGEGAPSVGYAFKEAPVLIEANKQLQEYFKGQRKEFSLPLAPVGTEFMLRVWEALRTIPYGETRTYKEIATAVGNNKACRAVGMANNRNPISIVTPCHRVIGSNGDLVGYAGGLNIKSYLLDLERK